jgi:hypothetical protein
VDGVNKPKRRVSFTGQAYIEDAQPPHAAWRESVACYKCHRPISLRECHPEDTGLAWFDPYIGMYGKYVHKECLSNKRAEEVGAVEEQERRQFKERTWME